MRSANPFLIDCVLAQVMSAAAQSSLYYSVCTLECSSGAASGWGLGVMEKHPPQGVHAGFREPHWLQPYVMTLLTMAIGRMLFPNDFPSRS